MAKVQDAVEILLALDVQEIIDLVDRDQTGEQSAQHLAARLRGDADCPDHLPAGSDQPSER